MYLYILLVTGSIGAFLLDQVFLAEPESAAADTTQTIPSPAINADRFKDPASDQINLVEDPSLKYLEKMQANPSTRDVFTPTYAMQQHYEQLKKQTEQAENSKAGPKPGSPEEFKAQNTLQATYVSNGNHLAVINGDIYRVGEFIGEFRITNIDSRRVMFSRKKEKVILRIPLPNEAATSNK